MCNRLKLFPYKVFASQEGRRLQEWLDFRSKQQGTLFLFEATARGHIEVLTRLQLKGINFRARSGLYSSTILHEAVENGDAHRQKDVISWIISHVQGININDTDSANKTALYIAADKRNVELVHFLCQCGGDTNRGLNPLILAAKEGLVEVVRALLEMGADPNWLFAGVNALSLATREGNDEVVQVLLENGANPNSHVQLQGTKTALWDTLTPLDIAVEEGHPTLILCFAERSTVPDITNAIRNIAHNNYKNKKHRWSWPTDIIFTTSQRRRNNPLLTLNFDFDSLRNDVEADSTMKNFMKTMENLQNADNVESYVQSTLATEQSEVRSASVMEQSTNQLLRAICCGAMAGPCLHTAIEQNDVEIVQLLLENGVNPSIVDANGISVLEKLQPPHLQMMFFIEVGSSLPDVTALMDLGYDYRKVIQALHESKQNKEEAAILLSDWETQTTDTMGMHTDDVNVPIDLGLIK